MLFSCQKSFPDLGHRKFFRIFYNLQFRRWHILDANYHFWLRVLEQHTIRDQKSQCNITVFHLEPFDEETKIFVVRVFVLLLVCFSCQSIAWRKQVLVRLGHISTVRFISYSRSTMSCIEHMAHLQGNRRSAFSISGDKFPKTIKASILMLNYDC